MHTGSKDTLPIQGAQRLAVRQFQQRGDKVDIVNAYAAAYIRPSDNHLILYYGVEKSSPHGDVEHRHVVPQGRDRGLRRSPAAVRPTSPARIVDGDILLVSEFTNGGGRGQRNAYRWNGNDATGSLGTTPIASGQLCGTDGRRLLDRQPGLRSARRGRTPTRTAATSTRSEFFEGGVDVGPPGMATCFATAVMNTRSSTSSRPRSSTTPDSALPVCGG